MEHIPKVGVNGEKGQNLTYGILTLKPQLPGAYCAFSYMFTLAPNSSIFSSPWATAELDRVE